MSEKPESFKRTHLVELTAEIVSAFVGNNAVASGALPDTIRGVYAALASLDNDDAQPKPRPAVPIKRSVQPDYLICLEDGRELKMLKRHLNKVFDMTPDEYRAKWGLSADYPMVAPNYAAKRSKLAKAIGLGKKPRKSRTSKS